MFGSKLVPSGKGPWIPAFAGNDGNTDQFTLTLTLYRKEGEF